MNIEEQMTIMKQYLLMKYHQEDWHGVMDAAADIREIVLTGKLEKNPKWLSKVKCAKCGHKDAYFAIKDK